MGFDKILNQNTTLRSRKVDIDGVQIHEEEIITIEVINNFDNFSIIGSLKIKDTFDINNSGLINLNGDNILTISVQDFFGNKSKRTYRIIGIQVKQSEERFKFYEISFIDEISFILGNTFISKSFTDTPINALKTYFAELGLDKIIKSDKLNLDIVDTMKVDSFVVPQNISVLDFFTERLKRENIRMWQDRNGLHIKEISLNDLNFGVDVEGNEIEYSNKTTNNYYIYKIHEFYENKNMTGFVNTLLPLKRTFRYNTEKLIVDKTSNLVDEIQNLKLNSMNMEHLQLTKGEKYDVQPFFETGNQRYDIFETYIKNNQLYIIVGGDLKNSIPGLLANVELKGNIMNPDSVLKGDVLSSGKYFIWGVSDRYIGDKLMHKLSLFRLDAKEPK